MAGFGHDSKIIEKFRKLVKYHGQFHIILGMILLGSRR